MDEQSASEASINQHSESQRKKGRPRKYSTAQESKEAKKRLNRERKRLR